MFKLWASAEMVSLEVLQGNKAEWFWMQDDSQAFHTQWKALLQSVALSFAASTYHQYRQISHMAGFPAYMNMGPFNMLAASSSVASFFSLCLGLCSARECYTSDIQSK